MAAPDPPIVTLAIAGAAPSKEGDAALVERAAPVAALERARGMPGPTAPA